MLAGCTDTSDFGPGSEPDPAEQPGDTDDEATAEVDEEAEAEGEALDNAWLINEVRRRFELEAVDSIVPTDDVLDTRPER